MIPQGVLRQLRPVSAGDDGGGHGIRNTGADDLVFIALIIRK